MEFCNFEIDGTLIAQKEKEKWAMDNIILGEILYSEITWK